MLAQILAVAVALSSLALFLVAFLVPGLHRKSDFVWSGVGLFYALVLWVCAARLTGALLAGQTASVALLIWFGAQAVSLRPSTPATEQAASPSRRAMTADKPKVQPGELSPAASVPLPVPEPASEPSPEVIPIVVEMTSVEVSVNPPLPQGAELSSDLPSEVEMPDAPVPTDDEVEIDLPAIAVIASTSPDTLGLSQEPAEPVALESQPEPPVKPASKSKAASGGLAKTLQELPGIFNSLKEALSSLTRRKHKPTIVLNHPPAVSAPAATTDELEELESIEDFAEPEQLDSVIAASAATPEPLESEQSTSEVNVPETAPLEAVEDLSIETEIDILNNEIPPAPEAMDDLIQPETFTPEGEVATGNSTESAAETVASLEVPPEALAKVPESELVPSLPAEPQSEPDEVVLSILHGQSVDEQFMDEQPGGESGNSASVLETSAETTENRE